MWAETGTVTSETGAVSVYSTTVTSSWTTSTWTTAVATTSDYELASSSDTLIGNTLAFSGLASGSTGATTGTLKFWTFSVGVTTTAPTEQTIESSTAAWQSAIGSEGTTIFLFDASVSTINYYYSANLGYTWSSKFVATVYEPSITGLSGAGAGTMAVTWTNGNPSVGTFNVRFASLSSLAVTNNSGFAVHAVSLFITQPSTNTLLSYYEINSSGALRLLARCGLHRILGDHISVDHNNSLSIHDWDINEEFSSRSRQHLQHSPPALPRLCQSLKLLGSIICNNVQMMSDLLQCSYHVVLL